MTERNINVKFSLSGADASRNDIEKIRKAAGELADQFVAAGQKITNHLENIQNHYDRVARKSNQGKAIVAADLTVMVQQFRELELAIESSFGSVENAPAEFQEAFGKARQQLDATTEKVRESTAAVKDHATTLDQAGERWTGLGSAVKKAAGEYGVLLGKIGLIVAAFKQGWEVGSEFARQTGADMTTLDKVTEQFKSRLGAMNNELSNVAVSLFSGNLKEAGLNAIAAGRALDLSKEALEGYKIALQFGVAEAEKFMDKTDELVELQEAYATALDAGKEGQELLYEAWNKADGSAKKFLDELNKVKPELDALKKKLDEAKDAERKRQEAVADGIKQIDSVITALEKEKAARKAGTESLDAEMGVWQNVKQTLSKVRDSIASQEDATKGLTGSVGFLVNGLDLLMEKQILNAKAAGDFAAGLRTSVEVYGSKIAPATQQQILQLAEMLEKYGELDEAEKKHAATIVNELQAAYQASNVELDKATRTISNVKEGAAGLQIEWTNMAEKTGEAAVKVKSAVSILDEVKDKLDKLFGLEDDSAIDRMNQMLDEVDKKMEALATGGAQKLKEAMEEIKTSFYQTTTAMKNFVKAGTEE